MGGDWGHAPINQRRDSLTGSSAWRALDASGAGAEGRSSITARRSVDTHRWADVDMHGRDSAAQAAECRTPKRHAPSRASPVLREAAAPFP